MKTQLNDRYYRGKLIRACTERHFTGRRWIIPSDADPKDSVERIHYRTLAEAKKAGWDFDHT